MTDILKRAREMYDEGRRVGWDPAWANAKAAVRAIYIHRAAQEASSG